MTPLVFRARRYTPPGLANIPAALPCTFWFCTGLCQVKRCTRLHSLRPHPPPPQNLVWARRPLTLTPVIGLQTHEDGTSDLKPFRRRLAIPMV